MNERSLEDYSYLNLIFAMSSENNPKDFALSDRVAY